MTSPVNAASSALLGTSSTTQSSNSSTTSASTTQPLGQDAFLKLLMAQLSNQDPLQPTDSTQFVTQLSQFSMVEQSQQQSTQLSNISAQLQTLGSNQATSMVGKLATVQSTGMTWDGTFAPTASVTLGGPAQAVTALVKDSTGNTVRTMTLGAQPAGTLQVPWDGKLDSGNPAPAGSYSVSVTAAGAAGQAVEVDQTVSGIVTQVTLNGTAPSLTLSNGAVAPLSQLVSVAGAPAAQTTQTTSSNNSTL
jgi:flagellar basal-body rod modification protein FlgD